nr:MAG TPA: hypothetical protein [Caudoviricetes sp.]
MKAGRGKPSLMLCIRQDGRGEEKTLKPCDLHLETRNGEKT